MSERLLSTGKIATFLAVIAVAGALAWLYLPGGGDQTVEARSCKPDEGVLANFQPSDDLAPVPETSFLDNDEKKRSLADYKGRGVVLNFWATWCAPCVREMPQLDRLNALLKGSGIEVLTVSEDRKGLPIARKFFEVNKLRDLEILADPKGKLLRALNGRGLPTTVIIDRQGREVGRVAGVAEWDAPETVGFLKNCLGS
ncbi:MAG: TlpA family protein disulfide reductase [Rhodospirillaceae bacterium]|nr:TlpA family protein disulfide reductase [Rhodospirillaceae bacterium]